MNFYSWLNEQQNRTDMIGSAARAVFRSGRPEHFVALLNDDAFLATMRLARQEYILNKSSRAAT